MNTPQKTSPLPVYIALALLAIFAVVFLIEFINLSQTGDTQAVETPEAETYMDVLTPLLENADAANGPMLIQKHGCAACHVAGVANRLAPAFDGLGDRADERHPPLTAEAYLYESIIHPQAFEVEGYIGQMPQIFEQQIPENELGDIIAYLLTLKES